tara:strand:- start:425 stop:811 length:387 start_codon:yes stop_codon:yes gene_type:complete
MTELRYWERVGFMVSRDQAEEIASRMNSASGKVLDDDLEEFVEARTNLHEVLDEIEILFENPPTGDKTLSEDNQAIIALMDFESNKKAFIKERKAEGMELAEAKEAYEFAKAAFVREALGLPEPEEEE